MKVKLRRFQAVESENVPEKVYDIIKKRFAEKKNMVGLGWADAHANKYNGNIKK